MNRLLHRTLRSLLGLGVTALALASVAAPAAAQTSEGTTIRNIASVSYKDANGTSYTRADTLDLVVSFKSGLAVTPDGNVVTPASPASGRTATLTVTNTGNGPDTVQVAVTSSDASVAALTGNYTYGGTTYTSLAALNTALASVQIPASGSIDIDVEYDVPGGAGGGNATISLTATSERDGGSDSGSESVQPLLAGTVSVTPDGKPGESEKQLLPSGTANQQYSFDFTLTNNLTAASTFSLTASQRTGGQSNGNATITVVSVSGTAGASATSASVAAGASATVTVVYEVDGSAGDDIELVLSAQATVDGTKTDEGHIDVVLVEPSFTVTKTAVTDNAGSPTSTAVTDAKPGDVFWYKITVQVTGAFDVTDVSVSDPLPSEVTYLATQGDAGSPSWSLGEAAGTVTGTLTTLSVAGGSRSFWIKVQVD